MKARRPTALWGLVVLTVLPACTGYRDLVSEVDEYQPSPFYRSTVRPQASKAPSPARSADDFEQQVARLEGAKAKWEQALEAGPAAESFYIPDPGLAKALRQAAEDVSLAAEAVQAGFTLEHLEVLALLRNPGVGAARATLRATLERYDQAWNLDEILRQYTSFTEGVMTGVGPTKGREPVQMKFPFPGMLALKGEIVGQEVRAARESLEIARRMAVTGARTVYWNLLFVRAARQITAEMLGLLRHLDSVAKTRYEAGKTSFQDVIKVRIQKETVAEDLNTLAEKQANLEAKIRELLALPTAAAIGAPAPRESDPLVPELEPLYDLALQRKQELRRMRAMVGKMERMIEMAESRILPSYGLSLSLYQDEAVAQVGTSRMKEPFAVTTTAQMGAGLPKMPWYGANDGFIRETRQKLEALRMDLRKAEDRTGFAVREAWFRLDQAAREERLFARSIVDLSQAALEVSNRGYEAGRVMFADVIASYTTWLKANLALERKRADLGVARAELEAAVGAKIKDEG